jgi:hypothetical protein
MFYNLLIIKYNIIFCFSQYQENVTDGVNWTTKQVGSATWNGVAGKGE